MQSQFTIIGMQYVGRYLARTYRRRTEHESKKNYEYLGNSTNLRTRIISHVCSALLSNRKNLMGQKSEKII